MQNFWTSIQESNLDFDKKKTFIHYIKDGKEKRF